MNELQAGTLQSPKVLGQPSVLVQPDEAALDDPVLGNDLECAKFATFGDLPHDVLAQNVARALREGNTFLTDICLPATGTNANGPHSPSVNTITTTMSPRTVYLLTIDAVVTFKIEGLCDRATKRFRSLLVAQAMPWMWSMPASPKPSNSIRRCNL